MTSYKRGLQALKRFKQGMYQQGLHGEQPGWMKGLPEHPTDDDILNTAAEWAEKLFASVCPDAPEYAVDNFTAFLACGINAWLRGCTEGRKGD